jgi:radical SAM superfamily enzyme YgiQ (UPF0313 family)
MKIILVDPPWYKLVGSHYNSVPLGICYISSYLRSKGLDTIIYNSDYEDNDHFLTQYERLKQYDKYISILNDENNPFWKKPVNDILNLNPEVVGFSICQPTLKSALIMAKLLKKEKKDINIIFGGPQITVNPIKYDFVDHIVVGEGELSILKCLNKNSEYRIDSETIDNIDILPFPDKDNLYFKGKYMEYGHMITGRGCPFNCIFCSSSIIWKNKFRLRSIKNVVEEMFYLNNRYNCKEFLFRDDTFTITPKRTIGICEEIKDKEFQWECDTRVDNLSYSLLKIMKNAGCRCIKIGVESGSDRVLKMMNKRITKDKVRQVVSDCKKLDIRITTYFMTGLPTETKEEIRETINFAKELDPDDIGLSLATPYCGTKIKDLMEFNENELEKYFHQSPDVLNSMVNKDIINEFYEFANSKRKKRYW